MKKIILLILLILNIVLYCSAFQLIGSGKNGAGGGFDCTPYSFYSTLNSLDDLENPDCGTGGTNTDSTFPGVGIQKDAATTSGFAIPSSNIGISEFQMEFDFIPSHQNNNTTVYDGWVTIFAINAGNYNSMRLRGTNGGGNLWNIEFTIWDNSANAYTATSGWVSDIIFLANVTHHYKITFDKAAGDLNVYVDTDNNGTFDFTYTSNNAAITMGAGWYSSSPLDFFKSDTHTSKIANLEIFNEIQ